MKEILHAGLILLLMLLYLCNIEFGSHRIVGRQRWVGTALALTGIVGLMVLVSISKP